jgi:hypothetical protein
MKGHYLLRAAVVWLAILALSPAAGFAALVRPADAGSRAEMPCCKGMHGACCRRAHASRDGWNALPECAGRCPCGVLARGNAGFSFVFTPAGRSFEVAGGGFAALAPARYSPDTSEHFFKLFQRPPPPPPLT